MNGSDVVVATGTGVVAHLVVDLDGQLSTVEGRLTELGPTGGVWESTRALVPDAALEATLGIATPVGMLIARIATLDGLVARFTLQARDNPTLMELQATLLST